MAMLTNCDDPKSVTQTAAALSVVLAHSCGELFQREPAIMAPESWAWRPFRPALSKWSLAA